MNGEEPACTESEGWQKREHDGALKGAESLRWREVLREKEDLGADGLIH